MAVNGRLIRPLIGTLFRNLRFSMASVSGKGAITKLGPTKQPEEVTNEEWKTVLTRQQYEVTRKSGTEQPFTGKYDKFFEPGKYHCVCCGAPLFESSAKYDSGCGWPAFSKSIDDDLNIERMMDDSTGRERVEVRCKKCDAHLGHVFEDGPPETRERYCINSASMEFVKDA